MSPGSPSGLVTENPVLRVKIDSEAEAIALRQQIDEGETISALAEKYTQRADTEDGAGLLRMSDYERLAMSQLYKAAAQAEVGQVVGPIEVREGYSLFKVLDREPGDLKPFDDVERKAMALVRGEKKEAQFEAWIDALMEKYSERVAVSEEALEKALPDAFLTRMSAGNGE